MSLIRIDYNPSRRQLALFGFFWLLFFTAVGLVLLRRNAQWTTVTGFWLVAALIPAIGWIFPKFMRIVYLGMTYLALPIGFVLSLLIIAIIYYLVLTPIGLLMRAFRYDPMNRGFEKNNDSYWIARDNDKHIKSYFQQF